MMTNEELTAIIRELIASDKVQRLAIEVHTTKINTILEVLTVKEEIFVLFVDTIEEQKGLIESLSERVQELEREVEHLEHLRRVEVEY